MSPKHAALILAVSVLAATAHSVPTDVGYNLLYTSNSDSFDLCIDSPNLPASMRGVYLLQGVGLFDFMGYNFSMLLDGFGKLYKFSFLDGKVCASGEMMSSGWYNQSIALGMPAPGLLFEDTKPARPKCPLFKPLCHAQAPNDNDYVLAVNIGDTFFLTTDSAVALEYHPGAATNQVHKWVWDKDDLKVPLGQILSMGAAHTVQLIDDPNTFVGIATASAAVVGGGTLYFYKLSAANPHQRLSFQTIELPPKYVPYIHNFGLTKQHGVVVLQPMSMSIGLGDLHRGTMSKAIKSWNKDRLASSIAVVPLDGSKTIFFYLDKPFWSVHVVNTFENATAITMDVNSYPASPWGDPIQDLANRRNKTARDASLGRPQIYRVILHIAGPLKGKHLISNITSPLQYTDFPVINPSVNGMDYCIFYANEQWTNGLEMGSQAIVRYDLCEGTVKRWHRMNVYPAEPAFLSAGEREEDGWVFFVALHGEEKVSYMHVLNASTMEEVEGVQLPTFIPFSAHGRIFPLGSLKSKQA